MLNQIFLMGRLVRDPELKHTAGGDAVTVFTLAVNRDFSKEKQTDFIDCVAWKSVAEFVSKHFTKGTKVVVSGRLQIRNWVDKNDNNRKSSEVIVTSIYHADSVQATKEDNSIDELPF